MPETILTVDFACAVKCVLLGRSRRAGVPDERGSPDGCNSHVATIAIHAMQGNGLDGLDRPAVVLGVLLDRPESVQDAAARLALADRGARSCETVRTPRVPVRRLPRVRYTAAKSMCSGYRVDVVAFRHYTAPPGSLASLCLSASSSPRACIQPI